MHSTYRLLPAFLQVVPLFDQLSKTLPTAWKIRLKLGSSVSQLYIDLFNGQRFLKIYKYISSVCNIPQINSCYLISSTTRKTPKVYLTKERNKQIHNYASQISQIMKIKDDFLMQSKQKILFFIVLQPPLTWNHGLTYHLKHYETGSTHRSTI